MKAWLNLVKERNTLVRRTGELSLQMKILELEDRQFEIEKELRDMPVTGMCFSMWALCTCVWPPDDPDEADEFQALLQELVLVVDERDSIVQQVEMDRIR